MNGITNFAGRYFLFPLVPHLYYTFQIHSTLKGIYVKFEYKNYTPYMPVLADYYKISSVSPRLRVKLYAVHASISRLV